MYSAGRNILLAFLFITACDLNVENPEPDPRENPEYANWLIPKNRIINRGDSLLAPALDQPEFTTTAEIDFLGDKDLVVGICVDGSIRAYPVSILNYHEVVNDVFLRHDIVLSYSPLTATAAAWDRGDLKGFASRFSVSKYIYNSNHILFDSETAGYWMPMRFECVNGSLEGYDPDRYPVIKTNWGTWKDMFPGTRVLTEATGSPVNYAADPYGQYRKDESILFSTDPIDDRLPLKTEVHGIVVNNRMKVYPESLFADSTFLIQDNFQGVSVVVAGNKEKNFIVSYERRIGTGVELDFSVCKNGSPNMIMQDNEGNRYDLFGIAVDGPDTGRELRQTKSMSGYWFALAASYPGPVIYQ